MTEEEAKKKWCPFRRYVSLDGLGLFNGTNPRLNCLGSQCMAWRATANEVGPTPPNERGVIEYKPAGYCGLAGKP